jgi:hypothetical protein
MQIFVKMLKKLFKIKKKEQMLLSYMVNLNCFVVVTFF